LPPADHQTATGRPQDCHRQTTGLPLAAREIATSGPQDCHWRPIGCAAKEQNTEQLLQWTNSETARLQSELTQLIKEEEDYWMSEKTFR